MLLYRSILLSTFLLISQFSIIRIPAYAEKNNDPEPLTHPLETELNSLDRVEPQAVIITRQLGGYGHIAYTYTLAEIIKHYFPFTMIKVIIEYNINLSDPRNHPFINYAKSKNIEELYISDSQSELNNERRMTALQWISSSDIVFTTTNEMSSFPISESNTVHINEIQDNHIAIPIELALQIRNHRNWKDRFNLDINYQDIIFNTEDVSVTIPKETVRCKDTTNIWLDYLCNTEWFTQINNISFPAEDLATLISNNRFWETPPLYRKRNKRVTGDPTLSKKTIQIGLTDSDDGILIRPSLLEKATLTGHISFQQTLNDFLKTHPDMNKLFSEISLKKDNNPNFYFAYMHSAKPYAEYISIISMLERNREPWILSNINHNIIDNPYIHSILVRSGISKIRFIDMVKLTSETLNLSESNESSVNLVRLPILDDDIQNALFALSQNPVGVTGNMSLFNSIALGKIPYYDAHHNYQHHINNQLRSFDKTSKLEPFFTNILDPTTKARSMRAGKSTALQWSTEIIRTRSANKTLINLVESITGWTATPPDTHSK